MPTIDSSTFRLETSAGAAMEGSLPIQILGKGWQTKASMCQQTPLCLDPVCRVQCHLPWSGMLRFPSSRTWCGHTQDTIYQNVGAYSTTVSSGQEWWLSVPSASRWRVLHTVIKIKPTHADAVILASCIPHNYLLSPTENQMWIDEGEQRWDRLRGIRNMGGHRGPGDAYQVREKLCTFFFNSPERRVSLQDNMV